MADNYNVSVTLDSFNGIITKNPNGDGTYNVTYANLTNGQIEAIGTAIKTAMQTSLNEVALSGEYDDLNVKPGIPSGYTQESNFNKVAFSGKASDLDNTDDNDEQVFLTKAIFDTTEASKITDGKIAEWDAKSDFSGNYNDLNGAPALPIDTEDENSVYITINEDTENEQRIIRPFSKVAFTNNYTDLNNTFFSINFGEFIYRYNNDSWSILDPNNINTQQDYELLNNCGFQAGFIENIDQLYNSNDENKISLINQISLLYNAFSSGQICYNKKDNFSYYLITELVPSYADQALAGLTIYCTLTNQTNYFSDIINNSFSTNENIQDNLNAIQISSTNITIIIDLIHNILYSIPRTIAPIVANNKSVYVDWKNNGVNVKISTEENNKLQLITTSGKEGLYVS